MYKLNLIKYKGNIKEKIAHSTAKTGEISREDVAPRKWLIKGGD